jgi:hypothetical protein
MNGGQQMLDLIKECAEDTFNSQEPVHPEVRPCFLRRQLASSPPLKGKPITHLMEMTKTVLYPGVMKWQSPKFFGYFSNGVNVTCIFADMFNIITQTPNFNFAVAPAWTEL